MFPLLEDSFTRIKTALVLFGIFIVISYIDILFFVWLFFGFFMIVGVKEANKLFGIDDFTIYIIAISTWFFAYFIEQPEYLIFISIIVFSSILAYKQQLDKKSFLSLLYPLGSFLIMLSLYKNYGIQTIWWMIFIVAFTDTAAYYIGKSIGKTSFCITSPNKTLEGVIGGVLCGSIFGALFGIDSLSYIVCFFISLFVSIGSIFGDLFESYLKREAGVKDSGRLLPGHGGVLDRTDGFLFSSIILLFLLKVSI